MAYLLLAVPHHIDTDINDDGGQVCTWNGPTPTCPECGDALDAGLHPGAYDDLLIICDCGLSLEVH